MCTARMGYSAGQFRRVVEGIGLAPDTTEAVVSWTASVLSELGMSSVCARWGYLTEMDKRYDQSSLNPSRRAVWWFSDGRH
jgi:hypothetical protein